MSDPIDRYLDDLAGQLRGDNHAIRRILAETEDHLRESALHGVEEGLARDEAEQRALERFGTPAEVALGFARTRPLRELVAPVLQALLTLGGIGLAAIGLSGLLAAGLGALFGHGFVAGDLPGVTYTPARCTQYLALTSHAGSCASAALSDHYAEVVQFRVAAGVLGVLALGMARWARARGTRRPALPDGLVAVAGATLFGAAAVGLIGQSVAEALSWGTVSGMGAYLSGGLVALLVAAGFAGSVLRTLRRTSIEPRAAGAR